MTSSGSSPIPKWQLALVVGAPVALGLGYMYYRNKNSSSSSKVDKPERDRFRSGAAARENGAPADKQISIDGDCKVPSPAAESETPLQKAQKYKNEGNVHFKAGKYDEAIARYNKAIDICPKEKVEDLATFYQNRAAAYEQLKKYSAVKADCTKALELNPKYAKALLRRARALKEIGELEAALEDVTIACILENFSNQTSLTMADKILEKLGKQHAQENLANKDFIMPSKHFIKTYIISFPNDPVFTRLQHPENIPEFFKKPLQALKDTEYDDIIPLCTEIIKRPEFNMLPSSRIEVLLLRATFYLLLGKHTVALEDFESILNSEDTSDDVKINSLIKRAALHMQLEDTEMTFKDFELAIKMNPSYSDIYHHRGQVNLLMNRIDEAKRDFEKAVEYNPNFGIAYVQKCYTDYHFAMFNREHGLAEAAVRDFERAFEKYPDPPECTYSYIMYAQMMCETQEYQKADAYFAKAIEKDPENATVYVHRGLLQLQWNGNVDKTVEYINKAIELDEKCELAYESLGSIEVQRGNIEEAIKLFDKALMLCRTFMELTHIYSLRDAAKTQLNIKNRLGMDVIRPSRFMSNHADHVLNY
ncbi:mitochondrial import receptor subunit TOM70 isoform X1 [Solenopsis invicta]|uniref:mitochondrial import receptor subunit TOM70 isoform X1 n=1 Tax=Solenopsis invicta TaxID=13686 RepID=UPI0005962E50|nr:mitochondrial import receptor subunit TOM70 isoform X1 [Solenopsis invicta]